VAFHDVTRRQSGSEAGGGYIDVVLAYAHIDQARNLNVFLSVGRGAARHKLLFCVVATTGKYVTSRDLAKPVSAFLGTEIIEGRPLVGVQDEGGS
jgi:hypothetical protein